MEYISVSLIQDASSLEKKIFTAIDSPFQIPRQTSPYLGIILKEKEFGFATFQLICKYLHAPSLANALPKGNLLGESSLNKEGKTRTAARGHRVVEDLP